MVWTEKRRRNIGKIVKAVAKNSHWTAGSRIVVFSTVVFPDSVLGGHGGFLRIDWINKWTYSHR